MSLNHKQDFQDESEEEISERITRDLGKYGGREGFSDKELIVIAARKLADEGHSPYLAGQVTVRAAESDTFWSTDMMKNFNEIGTEDLVRFNRQMEPVEGGSMPNPGVRFHLWIYDQRPDVNAIVHTHPPYASALSLLESELIIAHMDAMMFYDDCAVVTDWPGLPVGNSEGQIIAAALGETKRSVLLGHHGILTVGKSIEEALYLAVMMENAAKMQVRASSVGKIKPVNKELSNVAREFVMRDSIINTTVDSWGRTVLGAVKPPS